jgi:hypothetical protein
MIKLNSVLSNLINDNFVGVKQSFEDEGVLLEDVILMRRFTELNNLKLSVKIGGCEAITDIHNCKSIGVDGIVAPMIETEFALQKFIESVIGIENIDFYINIESKSGYENLDKILKSPASKLLKGIVVGRSDLTKSYGYDKNLVDSDFVFSMVKDIMKKSKKYNLTTLMGGNLSPKSLKFISKLNDDNLIDYIETRNVIIKINKSETIETDIKNAIEFESLWLDFKANKYTNIGNLYQNRAELLKNRL